MSRADFLTALELPISTHFRLGELVVVEEIGHGVHAQFATHFLLRDFILQQQSSQTVGSAWGVVLVATTQSGRNWSDIATKLGWDFKALQKQGHLHLIDFIEEEWSRISVSNSSDKTLTETTTDDLFSRISSALDNSKTGDKLSGPNLILIEDLSALLFAGQLTERALVTLVFRLKCLAKSHDATLVTLVHSSPPATQQQRVAQEDGDAEGDRLAGLIAQNYSDLCLTISPLSTGASAQITGHIQVKQHLKHSICNKSNTAKGGGSGRLCRLAQYKLDERSVRVNFILGS